MHFLERVAESSFDVGFPGNCGCCIKVLSTALQLVGKALKSIKKIEGLLLSTEKNS